MAEVERLITKLEGDISGLQASLSKADALTRQHMASMRRQTKAFDEQNRLSLDTLRSLHSAIAGLAGSALVAATESALHYASSISELSKQTGFGTDAIQELRYAAVQNGLSVEELDKALVKMTVTVGEALTVGGEAAAVYKKLGVSLVDTSGNVRSSQSVFDDVIKKLSKVGDEFERNSLLVKIFGKDAGPKLGILVSEGADGLDRLRQAAHDAGAVLDKDLIQNANKTADKLDALSLVIKTQLTASLVQLGPALVAASEGVADFTKALIPAAKGVGEFFAQLASGSDQPFIDKIEHLQARIGRLKVELEIHKDQESEGLLGKLFGIDKEKTEKELADAEAELARFRNMYLDFQAPNRPKTDEPAPPLKGKPGISEDDRKKAEEALKLAKEKAAELDKTASKEVERARERNAAQLKELSDSLKSEEEQIAASYQKRREIIGAAIALDIGDRRENFALLAKLDKDEKESQLARDLELVGAQKQAAEQLAKFETLTAKEKANAAMDIAQDLLSNFSQTSKTAFKIAKDLAIAKTIVNTYDAAMMAFASSSTWYEGAAKAAATIAYGLAQVSAIQRTQYGGSGAGNAAGTPSATVGGVGGGGFSAAPPSTNVYIRGINATDLYTGSQLVDLINKAQGDGAKLQVVS